MTNTLTPKKNLENELVRETKDLLLSVKRNYLLISANLFRIHEGWNGTVDAWCDFYEQDLELHKSQVSKMLKVGAFVLAHNMLKESVSYEKLYLSINAHKDEDPKYILSEAKTWSTDDYKQALRESCIHSKPSISVCPDCFKKI